MHVSVFVLSVFVFLTQHRVFFLNDVVTVMVIEAYFFLAFLTEGNLHMLGFSCIYRGAFRQEAYKFAFEDNCSNVKHF